jgi:aminopeptidase N
MCVCVCVYFGCVFVGDENVTLQVKSATKNITLHALEIVVKTASVTQHGKTVATLTNQTKDATTERVSLDFDNEIAPGDATLHLTFTGELNDKMAGFYRSKYVVNGETRYMATTQFEPTDARR